jgi:serine/threonine protein kinase
MEQGYGDMGQLLDFVGGTLPEKAVRFYAAQILLGLEYLHSYGVLYMATRDRNMLFDSKGNIKVSWFEFSGHSPGSARKTET